MRKAGIRLMIAAFWLAALGLLFSDPVGNIPEPHHLINFALYGLQVQLIRADSPTGYWINIVAHQWLWGCLLVFLAGVVLVGIAHYRSSRRLRT